MDIQRRKLIGENNTNDLLSISEPNFTKSGRSVLDNFFFQKDPLDEPKKMPSSKKV